MTALALTMLLGVVALAVDAGLMFDYRQQMQSAADAAALAGARELQRSLGIGKTQLDAFVLHETAANGFTHGTNGVTVTINRGPTSGPFLNDTNYVEVLISRQTPTFFMRLYNHSAMTVQARSVAGLGAITGCMYALGATQSKAIETSGSGTINVTGCDVFDNSTRTDGFFVGSGWTFTARSIQVAASDTTIAGVVTPAPITNAPPVADPFAGKTPPPIDASCDAAHTDWDKTSGTWTINPGTYCGGIRVRGTSIVNFNPGIYVLKDDAFIVKDTATAQNTSPTDSGVTLYFAGVEIKPSNFTSGTHVHLHATTTAGSEYRGILFYDNRVKTSNSNILDSDDQAVSGVLYYPYQHIEWKGNGGAYTILVADTMKFTGGSSLNSDFSSIGGPLAGGAPSIAEQGAHPMGLRTPTTAVPHTTPDRRCSVHDPTGAMQDRKHQSGHRLGGAGARQRDCFSVVPPQWASTECPPVVGEMTTEARRSAFLSANWSF